MAGAIDKSNRSPVVGFLLEFVRILKLISDGKGKIIKWNLFDVWRHQRPFCCAFDAVIYSSSSNLSAVMMVMMK